MNSEILMPSLGADMIDARMVEWHIGPGDEIHRGDIIFAVETDKGIIDVEAFEPGVVEKILVPIGEKVPVGTPLATLRKNTERKTAAAATHIPEPPLAAAKPKPPEPPISAPAATAPHSPRISPAARRRARELGIDPGPITGSGPQGAVTVEDVTKVVAPVQYSSDQSESGQAKTDSDSMRRAIAAAMARSKREIPHYYLSTTIDLSPALDWLERYNAERSVTGRAVYAVLLLKAVARALTRVPELNGFYRDNAFVPVKEPHVGMAISLRGGGLMVPGLSKLAEHSIEEVMTEFTDRVNRARSGHLRSSELSDVSITVTSLGEQGVETVFPVIHPPQVAIVGFGSVVEQVLPVAGIPSVRRVITASLAADHRASDGHRGAAFLAELNRLLQHPEQL